MELQHFDSEEDSSIDFDHSDEENNHNNNHKVNHNYTDNNDHTDDELEDITTLLFHQSMGLEMEPMLPQQQQQLPSSSTTTTRHTGNDFLSSTSERIIGTTTNTNTSSRRGIQQSSNSSGPIRTTSGTLLYARNTNSTTNNTGTTTGNNNNSNNNNSHYRTSLSFNSTGSRSNGSLTSSMSPQQRLLQRSPISPSPSSLTSLLPPLQQLLPPLSSSSSFKETINPNNTSTSTTYSTNNNTRPWKFWESSKIMNRYRSTATNTTTATTATATTSYNNHRIRTTSNSFHNSQLIRSTPRINTFLKILIIMILFCIVINYWERVSWTTYLVSNDSSMTTRSIDETTTDTEQYHMKNHVETYPPTISPTITTIIETTQNDDENIENNDDDAQNDEHDNDHPSSNIQQSSQSSLDSKKNSVLLWYQSSSIGMKKSSKTSNRNNNNKNNGNEFVEKWCDMRGTTWYPNVNTQTTTHSKHASTTTTTTIYTTNSTIPWQLRAPYFLLPGASYSGTVYVASILHSHPQILPTRTKELQFFYDKPFRKYIHPLTDKTLVHAARQRMYARDYNIQLLQQTSSQHSESTQYISFDATPGYLYYSTILPRRILCVEPWIKIVLLLRNPIDRILEQFYAQYSGSSSGSSSSSMNHKIPKHLSLDSCIQHELHLMEEVGLLNITDNNSKFYGSKEEDIAWYKYQSLSRIDGLIGRSMYVIQLRHWIAAFRMAGRVPSESILIVYSENFVLQPQYEYDRMVQFINIEPHTISTPLLDQMPQSLSHPTRYVSDETRQVLEDFFVPYNKQLQRLLYRYDISSTSD